MDEELVIEANRRMKRTIRTGNILTVLTFGAQMAVVLLVNLVNIDVMVKVNVLMVALVFSMLIIFSIAMWKQTAVFNVAMSLLRYIEKNYPGIELPSYKEDEE